MLHSVMKSTEVYNPQCHVTTQLAAWCASMRCHVMCYGMHTSIVGDLVTAFSRNDIRNDHHNSLVHAQLGLIIVWV